MQNRKLLTSVGIITLGGLLAACSGGGSQSDDETVTLQILTSTITEEVEGPIEQGYADAYMAENPDVKIEFLGKPNNDLISQIVTMATGGTLPDVFLNSEEFAPQAVDLGIAADLKPLLGEDYLDGFNETGLDHATIDDEVVFAPWYSIPTALIYRSDWLEEEGLEPPQTTDDLVAVAEALTGDTNDDGKVDRWGIALVASADSSGASRFIPLLRAFGGVELSQDGDSWKTGYDSPESASAFQFYGDLVNKYEVVPPGPLNTSYPEATGLIASGKAGMMVSGSNAIGNILAQNPDLDGKLAAVPLPYPSGGEPAASLGLGGYSISETSEHKEVAADYLKFVFEKENQLAWTDATGRLPMRVDALEQVKKDDQALAGYVDAIDYAYAFPTAQFYSAIMLAAPDAYQSVILGDMTGQEAAESAAKAAQQEIDNAN